MIHMPLFSQDEYAAGYIIKEVLVHLVTDRDKVVLLPVRHEKFVRNVPHKDNRLSLVEVYWFNVILLLTHDDKVCDIFVNRNYDGCVIAAQSLASFYPNGFRFIPNKIYDELVSPCVFDYKEQMEMKF